MDNLSYGLVGEKLGHSFSVKLHNELGNKEYVLKEISKDCIDEFFKRADFKGINVTIPYKETALKYCKVHEAAAETGAVNTLVKTPDGVYGYNTDYLGMEYMLSEGDISLEDKFVLILGTGGTSKTARYVCKRAKARKVLVASRTSNPPETVSYADKDAYKDAEIIINTTPVGMYPNVDNCPVELSLFTRLEAVCDVIYNPLKTRLTIEAADRGIRAVNGLSMLAAQGFYANRLFFGGNPDDELTNKERHEIRRLTDKLKEGRENIVLIGMPGVGKTTFARMLSRARNMEMIDTDELFREQNGMTPSDYILAYGEDKFRDAESLAVKEAASHNGIVIATGGGALLRKGNVINLKYNGRFYYIDRPIEALSVKGRPLSDGEGKLKKLYETRTPIYEKNADVTIRFLDTPAEISLGYDLGGYVLKGNGLNLRGDFTSLTLRIRPQNLNKEFLVKACKIKNVDRPLTIVDATAGMGEDSFLLAAAGNNVIMYEYNFIIATLLQDALRKAATDPVLSPIAGRLVLRNEDSIKALPRLPEKPDVILLDPMFPERQKSALIKKKFQLLQKLECPCTDEKELLKAAIAAKPMRIVIKRPLKGPFLAGVRPSFSIEGKAIRYDILINVDSIDLRE